MVKFFVPPVCISNFAHHGTLFTLSWRVHVNLRSSHTGNSKTNQIDLQVQTSSSPSNKALHMSLRSQSRSSARPTCVEINVFMAKLGVHFNGFNNRCDLQKHSSVLRSCHDGLWGRFALALHIFQRIKNSFHAQNERRSNPQKCTTTWKLIKEAH